MPDYKDYQKELSAYFEDHQVKFKPQSVSRDSDRAMPVAYVDARAVQERLDDVFGPDGWQASFETLSLIGDGDKVIKCRLSCYFVTAQNPQGVWITREDVGSRSEQQDTDDKTKSAVSDALKRVAVQFGIGRYLYSCKMGYIPYDREKRHFVDYPKLPDKFRKKQPAAQRQQPPAQQQQAAPPVASNPTKENRHENLTTSRPNPLGDPSEKPPQTSDKPKKEIKTALDLCKLLDDNEHGIPGITNCVLQFGRLWGLDEDWNKWKPADLGEAVKCLRIYWGRKIANPPVQLRTDDQARRLHDLVNELCKGDQKKIGYVLKDILVERMIHTLDYCSAEEMNLLIESVKNRITTGLAQ